MKIELKCQNCNEKFEVDYKFRDKKYCNQKCYFEYAKKNNILGLKKNPSVREERICVQCNKPFIERIKHKKKLCSEQCRIKWNSNETNIKNRIENGKSILIEKYGVDSLFKLESFREKCKVSFIEKYGVTHPMYVPEFVQKLKSTFKNNHLIHLLPKLYENNLELIDDYEKNKKGNTSFIYNFKCLKCDNIFTSTLLGSGKIPICRKCYPIVKNSKLEEIVRDFLNKNNVKHIDNNRTILGGTEIDLYLPDYNLGIEINGNYYHSDFFGKKDKKYHINKTILSNCKKVKLIQIFEDEILLKPNIVFSRLSNMLNLNEKIFARKCLIKEITKKESNEFLKNNHLQGTSIDKIRIGLFNNDNVVAVMTFGYKRKSLGNENKHNEYELLRYTSELGINVVGGFSKLLTYFKKIYNPNNIISYADCRWSGINPEDTVYYKNGFNFIHQTPPNYWYISEKNFLHRYHRFTFRKNTLINEGFSNEKTEWEIMREKKYDRIWDCGSMKFEYKI